MPCGSTPDARSPMAGLRRHDHLWLRPAGAARAQLRAAAGLSHQAARAALTDWTARGHPLIVARQAEGEQEPVAGFIAVGLALPPALGRHRLGFRVAADDVLRIAPPPLLQDCAAVLPAAWQPLIQTLLHSSALQDTLAAAGALPQAQAAQGHLGAGLRVYGSAALQQRTAQAWLRADSDLDLLLCVRDWKMALEAARVLGDIAAQHPLPRLDGELLAPQGWAMAWREVAGNSSRLLVKSIDAARLVARDEISAGFAAPAPAAQKVPVA